MLNHYRTNMAPAPSKAAAPITPAVFIGAATALLVFVTAAAPPPVDAAGEGTPEVNGKPLALDAPEKATAPAVAEGVAVVLDGLRSLCNNQRESQ
jgi:hypothetical protein